MKISRPFRIPPPTQLPFRYKISKGCHCNKIPEHLIQTWKTKASKQPWCNKCCLVRHILHQKEKIRRHRMLVLWRLTFKQLAKSLPMNRQRSKSQWCKSYSRGTVARGFRFSRPSSMISHSSRLNSTCPTRQTKTSGISNRNFSRLCPLICHKGLPGTKRRSENLPANQSTGKTIQTSERPKFG